MWWTKTFGSGGFQECAALRDLFAGAGSDGCALQHALTAHRAGPGHPSVGPSFDPRTEGGIVRTVVRIDASAIDHNTFMRAVARAGPKSIFGA
jgi:hypothetical protein